MINYFRESFRRKKARRITQEYPAIIDTFSLSKDGNIEFANWDNPLVDRVNITQEQVDFFRKFVQKGNLVIDIGANIGDTTVPIGLAAGKEGITLGFDPNPYVFKLLEKNAGLNKDKTNIVPVPCAISTQEEEFYYVSSEASFSNGGISKTKKSIHGKFVYPAKIKGVNLHNYIQDNYNGKTVTFIKIDTEGYDKEIIKSISDLITVHKPVIIAESVKHSSDEDKKELFDVLHAQNYKIYYFEDFHVDTKTALVEKAEDMVQWKNTINVYAIPNK